MAQNKNKTKQDKYKHSILTAKDDIKYRRYKTKKISNGEKPLPKKEWKKKQGKKK